MTETRTENQDLEPRFQPPRAWEGVDNPVIEMLVEKELLDRDQIRRAQRIQAKLPKMKPLLEVLKELKFIDTRTIHRALTENPLKVPLGELLVNLGEITGTQLRAALEMQKETRGKPLGEHLIDLQLVSERRLYQALSFQVGYPYEEVEVAGVDPELFAQGNPALYEKHIFLPLRR